MENKQIVSDYLGSTEMAVERMLLIYAIEDVTALLKESKAALVAVSPEKKSEMEAAYKTVVNVGIQLNDFDSRVQLLIAEKKFYEAREEVNRLAQVIPLVEVMRDAIKGLS